jgi:hypothetical protein
MRTGYPCGASNPGDEKHFPHIELQFVDRAQDVIHQNAVPAARTEGRRFDARP